MSYRDDLNLAPAQTPALPQGRREQGQSRVVSVLVVWVMMLVGVLVM